MPQTTVAISNPLTFKELKEFASTAGPAVTVYLPADVPGGPNRRLSLRIEKLAAELKSRCAERGFDSKECDEFLEPILANAGRIETQVEGPGVVMFRTPEDFRWYSLPREVEQQIHISDNVHVRPIADLLLGERHFYILALAQKDFRLLRATSRSATQVELPEGTPRSLLEFTSTDQPDHNQRKNSTNGTGSGITATTAKEHKDGYLYNYFVEINRTVNEVLKAEDKTPLILAGVEYELALYRQANTYQHLCPFDVRGAANSLKGGELHARALESLEQGRQEEIKALLTQHDKQAGGAADATVADIVKAAYDGRVSTIFIGKGVQAFGSFDDATHRVRQRARPTIHDEDLVNAAGVQTVLHGGTVVVLPPEQVPGGRPMAAIMRY